MSEIESVIGEEQAIDMAIDSAIYDFLAKKHKIYAEIQVTDLVYCPRKAYYEKKLGKREYTNNWSIFIGILLHDVLLQAMGEYLGADVEVLTVELFELSCGRVKLYAMCDLLADNYVLELKTTSYLPEAPSYNHLLQLETYLRLFDRDYGYLVYIERHYGHRKIFKHRRDDQLYQTFLTRLEDFAYSLKHNVAPSYKEYSLCKLGKSVCPYYELCYKAEKDR